jgi:hypothetical protein
MLHRIPGYELVFVTVFNGMQVQDGTQRVFAVAAAFHAVFGRLIINTRVLH